MLAGKQMIATAGAVQGPFTQARRDIANATEGAILGKSAAKAAIDRATDETDRARELARPILDVRRAR